MASSRSGCSRPTSTPTTSRRRPYLQERLGGKIGIGEKITVIQDTFGKIFNEGTRFQRDGSQFDKLFREGDTFEIGALTGRVLHTPGHTPACLTYLIGDAAFVGDTLFMPDFGTARADFPGGSAAALYASIQKLLALPDDTRIFVGHDYKAPGRDVFAWETTVAEQRARNVHVGGGASAADFVAMREARDKTLGMPKLIIPSLQVNMRAGRMPEPDERRKDLPEAAGERSLTRVLPCAPGTGNFAKLKHYRTLIY